jgi:hypothetical protein
MMMIKQPWFSDGRFQDGETIYSVTGIKGRMVNGEWAKYEQSLFIDHYSPLTIDH